jgi:hypothetical protein
LITILGCVSVACHLEVREPKDRPIDGSHAMGGPLGRNLLVRGVGFLANVVRPRNEHDERLNLLGGDAAGAREDGRGIGRIRIAAGVEFEKDLKGEAPGGDRQDALAFGGRESGEGILRRALLCHRAIGLAEHENVFHRHLPQIPLDAHSDSLGLRQTRMLCR